MSEKVTIKVERKELHLPTIALRGLVVFPNNLVHFEVGREKSIAAVLSSARRRQTVLAMLPSWPPPMMSIRSATQREVADSSVFTSLPVVI